MDVCKRDMEASEINPTKWEAYASDCPKWRCAVKTCIQRSDQKRVEQWEEKRQQRRQLATASTAQPHMKFVCSNCNRTCLSRIWLFSHSRSCTARNSCLKLLNRGTIDGVQREGVPESYCIREEAPLLDKHSGKMNNYLLGMPSVQGCWWSEESMWKVFQRVVDAKDHHHLSLYPAFL